MEDLQEAILTIIKETIPDINEAKASNLVEYLTTEDIGVRSLDRLYNVSLDNIRKHISECDADILYRSWQQKFRPNRSLRQLQQQHTETYKIKWETLPQSIIEQLEAGSWLPKTDRCLMIRLIVSDVLSEKPRVPRTFFNEVAKSMVLKYPTALHDRNKRLTDCKYMEQKLKFRYDEETRAYKVKEGNAAPNIPEAYGCIKWQVKITQADRETMTATRNELIDCYDNPPNSWSWEEILSQLRDTYPLQREDINSQVPKRKRRARGGAQQAGSAIKTTFQIYKDWPFLFHTRGMKQHFNILTETDWDLKLNEFKEKYELDSFIKFLSTLTELQTSNIRKKYKRNQTCKSPELIALLLMLLEYYKEEREAVLMEVEGTTTWEEVDNMETLPSTPCIVSLGTPFKAKKYFFSVDGMVVSSVKDFKGALSLLFCSFFVLNIKYTKGAGNALDFLQRVVANIEPEKGSKVRRANYKQPLSERLQTLLDKHATWENRNRNENDPNGDEDDPQV